MPVIVAVTMECKFVADLLTPALASGGDVIYLNLISILEEQSTPAAFPLLFVQELTELPIQHGMTPEPLCPVKQVTIIRACLSLHFDMLLDRSCSVLSEFYSVWSSEYPALAVIYTPVFPHNPMHVFVWVSTFGPATQLMVERTVTGKKGDFCYLGMVVVCPSSHDRSEVFDELFL